MTYRAPINDMLLALNHGAGLEAAVKAGHYGDFDGDIASAVLEEAGRFASDVLAPLNRVGDEHGIKLEANKVTIVPNDAVTQALRAELVRASSDAIETWKREAGPEAAAVLDAARR